MLLKNFVIFRAFYTSKTLTTIVCNAILNVEIYTKEKQITGVFKMLKTITHRIIAVICAAICMMCIFTVFISYVHRGRIFVLLSGFIILALLSGLFLLLKSKEKHLTKHRVRIVFCLCSLVLLICQLIFIRFLNYNYEMIDPKITNSFARSYVINGNFIDVEEQYKIYASKYPNTWGMIFLQIPFFALWKLFTGTVSIYAGQVFNIILIQLSSVFTFLTAERIFKQKSSALFCGILNTLTPAILLYTPYFHSDTAGMVFISGALYFLSLTYQSRQLSKAIVYSLIASLFLAFGNTVKGSLSVMLIAVVLVNFLRLDIKRAAVLSSTAVLIFIGVSKLVFYSGLAIGISDDKKLERYRFPITHWIMMSLNEHDYSHFKDDVTFTMSFDTYEGKKQANIKVIKERLKRINSPKKLAIKLYHKIALTWSQGGFNFKKYISKSNPSKELKQLLDNHILNLYIDGFHAAALIAAAFGTVYSAGKRRKKTFLLCLITTAGLITFLLIWENPPRYAVTFIPIYMLMCTAGIRYICAAAKKKDALHS